MIKIDPESSAIVLLSGGLDSTVSLVLASQECSITLALFFDYGQRSSRQEQKAAEHIAHLYDVPFRCITLPWLSEISSTSLVNTSTSIPHPNPQQLDDPSSMKQSAQEVWIPNRNGIFINIAAGFAEAHGQELIITGFNREEAATFPDNSINFIHAITDSLSFSTQSHVRVMSPTSHLDKKEIVKAARQLKIPIHFTWSCYEGNDDACGKCESCLRRIRSETID